MPLKRAILTVPLLLLAVGCNRRKAQVGVPPPPPPVEKPTQQAGKVATAPAPKASSPIDSLHVKPDAKPLQVQHGLASWYGAPYHNRRASNGEVYDMNAMTAAHLTWPLGSIVRVTNPKTGSTALVRITDRGPFAGGRVIDLSLAAAKKVDIWRAGVAEVRLELMEAPTSKNAAGRWAVQIGGFGNESPARKLTDRLTRRYQTAKVSCFSSPTGDWWVRVRVQSDDRARAESVVRETQVAEASVYLVRLD